MESFGNIPVVIAVDLDAVEHRAAPDEELVKGASAL